MGVGVGGILRKRPQRGWGEGKGATPPQGKGQPLPSDRPVLGQKQRRNTEPGACNRDWSLEDKETNSWEEGGGGNEVS